jgi:hypothetical protein
LDTQSPAQANGRRFPEGSFILQAGGANASLTNLAGYATLGGAFLISAIRLHRRAVRAK